jgi:hypothetical protein
MRAIIEQARVTSGVAMTGRVAVHRRARPLGLLAKLGIAAAGLALLTGSLAIAGVDLPGLPDRKPDGVQKAPAEDGTRSETSARVGSAIEANLPLLRGGDISGCEFGAMVSSAARDVEPDTSRCTEGDNGVDEVDGEPSETARRVQAAVEGNLSLLHDGEISGCEFGAIVSAAARGVEPDASTCQATGSKKADGPTEVEDGDRNGPPDGRPSPPDGDSGDKKGTDDNDATEAAKKPADKNKDRPNKTDEGERATAAQGKGGPPAEKPGSKAPGD